MGIVLILLFQHAVALERTAAGAQGVAHAAQSARELEQHLLTLRGEIRENAIKEKAERDAAVDKISTRIDGIQGAVTPLLPAIQKLADEMEKANTRASSELAVVEQYGRSAAYLILSIYFAVLRGPQEVRRLLNGKRSTYERPESR